MPTDIAELTRRAILASVEAGIEIMRVYATSFKVEMKEDRSPVTEADKRSGTIIRRCLQSAGIPFLDEETPAEEYTVRRKWTRCWIVDPLDGTKEFVRRNGEFTVNIALVENGIPLAGVIYAPVTEKIYYGGPALGARKVGAADFRNTGDGIALPVSSGSRPYTVVASRSHRGSETESYLQEKAAGMPGMATITGGSSMKFAFVAEGLADEYPRFGPTMEWDTAAGHALVMAVGKEVYSLETMQPLRYNRENLRNPSFLCK
ncbi:MAG: 3'(2'),5'-bisphosphate nucleotidase CysQ [Bacteroidia bacterium]|nr:3'(2'),5'-bisphosphate nucleotidase CysQ [Bacteroidia bacterium]